MFALEGAVTPGQHVVQQIVVVGAKDEGCRGAFVRFGTVAREYFQPPAFDLHSSFFAAEQRRFEVRRGWATVMSLPGTPPPIPSGQNAAELGQPYFASIGQAATLQLLGALVDESLGEWRMDYEYDGCNPPDQAATTCGAPHCVELRHRTRASASDAFGAWVQQSWAEVGSQW